MLSQGPDIFLNAERFFTSKQVLLVISRSSSGGLIRIRDKGYENLCVCRGPDHTFALASNGFNCFLIQGLLWVQLMIMANSSIDTVGTDVGALSVSVTPLLQACFTVAELLTARAAGSALTFVQGWLCADTPCTTSASSLASWRGNVVYRRGIWHLDVVITGSILPLGFRVSADRRSQLSVNDGGGARGFPFAWSQVFPRRLVLDLYTHIQWRMVVPSRLVLDLYILCLVQWR